MPGVRLGLLAVTALFASHLAASVGAAQQRPPLIATRPAGPGTIVGAVVDSMSTPIEGADVMIVSARRSTQTGADGRFRFDEVPRGRYELRVRRIGYDPQVRSVRVGDDGGAVDFVLTPRPQALPTVVTSAVRGGLAGVVGDSARRPVSNIEVRVLGAGKHARTEPDGSFFFDLDPGTYIVQVAGIGYAPRLVSVTIPSDSGRHVVIALQRGAVTNRAKLNAEELSRRLAWRSSLSTVYGREALQGMEGRTVEDIVRVAVPNPLSEACVAYLEGGPQRIPLYALDATDLESVEIYPPGSLNLTGAAGSRAPTRGRGARGGAVAVCPLVYVWRR